MADSHSANSNYAFYQCQIGGAESEKFPLGSRVFLGDAITRRVRCLYLGMDVEGKEAMVELPEEIVSEILLKVPVKSLLKFKRVCKLWNSIISSPQFIKKHLKFAHATHYNQHKMLIGLRVPSSVASNCCVWYEETSNGNLRAKQFDFPYQFPSDELIGPIVVSISSICDGLICFSMHTHGILIWNPSLPTEYKIIRTPDSGLKNLTIPGSRAIGMGYDSTVDDYKIVRIPDFFDDHSSYCSNCFIEVFSLKNNSWRKKKLSLNFSYNLEYLDSFVGVYTRNCTHWLADRVSNDLEHIEFIIYFDMVEERLGYVNLPSICCFKLLIYKDSLAVESEDGLWVLEDYCGMKSSWNKIFPIEKLIWRDFCYNYFFTKNGDILGETGAGFLTFGTKDGSCKETVIEGENIGHIENLDYAYFYPYVESLVSPRWWQ